MLNLSDTSIIVGWFITGSMVVGLAFVADYRINRNEREFKERLDGKDRDIEKVWNWKNSHEKDASHMREKFQMQLSELRGAQMVTLEQFRQIISELREIKERLTELENHKNGRN